MIRVSGGACGYSGYQCQKFAELPTVFSGGTMHCSGAYTTSAALFNNYGNIPIKAKGFVMQQPGTLADGLNIPSNKVPELLCSVDIDPFTTGGYWNMYSEFSTADLWWAREYENDGSGVVDARGRLSNGLLCFSAGTTAYKLTPGILEPVINTPFDPISIDAVTNFDASIDGIMVTLMMITKWRKIIEDKLNSLTFSIGSKWTTHYDLVANGLMNLMAAENLSSPCSNFKIYLISGTPVRQRIGEDELTGKIPTYGYTGGWVSVNGGVQYHFISGGKIQGVVSSGGSGGSASGGSGEWFVHSRDGHVESTQKSFTMSLKLIVSGGSAGLSITSGSVIMSETTPAPADDDIESGGVSVTVGDDVYDESEVDESQAYNDNSDDDESESDSGGTRLRTKTTDEPTVIYVPFGGVSIIKSDDGESARPDYDSAYSYVLYKTWQTECIDTVPIEPFRLAGASTGVVYRTGDAADLPYSLLGLTQCDDEDESSSN